MDDDWKKEARENVLKIIKTSHYLVLATADKNGTPWSAPLHYAFDQDFNFYFDSDEKSLHVQQMKSNPKVAISIVEETTPAGEGAGAQISGVAEEMPESSVTKAETILYSRIHPGSSKTTGEIHSHYSKKGAKVYKIHTLHVYTKPYGHERIEVYLK